MSKEEIAAELARLNKLLRARDGKVGYGQNVQAIKVRIAEIEAMTPDNG